MVFVKVSLGPIRKSWPRCCVHAAVKNILATIWVGAKRMYNDDAICLQKRFDSKLETNMLIASSLTMMFSSELRRWQMGDSLNVTSLEDQAGSILKISKPRIVLCSDGLI